MCSKASEPSGAPCMYSTNQQLKYSKSLILEDEGIMVLQIVGNHSTSNATLYPRRHESSESPL